MKRTENFGEKDFEEIKEWAEATVKKWNKLKPDYVFLTETAAIPFGYVLKETWKKAYGRASLPRFYRIDPKAAIPRAKFDEIVLKYASKRIEKDSPRIFIFDECEFEGPEPYFSNGVKVGRASRAATTWAVQKIHSGLKGLGKEGEIYVCGGGPDQLSRRVFLFPEGDKRVVTDDRGFVDTKGPLISRSPTSRVFAYPGHRKKTEDEALVSMDDIVDSVKKGKIEVRLTGRIVKHPEQRKRAIAYVDELKQIGGEAGKELRKELTQGDGLEEKLTSIIAISTLALSILLSSSKLTGLAVGGLNQTNLNLTGGLLFIIGLIASFFYFRRNKRWERKK